MSVLAYDKVEIRGDIHRSLHRTAWSSPIASSLTSFPDSEGHQNYVISAGKLRLSLQSVTDFTPKVFSIVDNDGGEHNVLKLTTDDGKMFQIRMPHERSFSEWYVVLASECTIAPI